MLPAPEKPIVCYVTDRRSLGAADAAARLQETIRAAIAAGADWVQIRERDLAGRALLGIVREGVAAAGAAARVSVNDRLDVALAAGAGGVHLGAGSAPARDLVRWCRRGNAPAEFLIGVSCHSVEEARAAQSAGASYLFFGPVFETPSKRAYGKPQGIAKLAGVCAELRRIPVIAIGGVEAGNGADCIRAGAAGIAAIRLFQETPDAGALLDAIGRLHRCPRARSGPLRR